MLQYTCNKEITKQERKQKNEKILGENKRGQHI